MDDRIEVEIVNVSNIPVVSKHKDTSEFKCIRKREGERDK